MNMEDNTNRTLLVEIIFEHKVNIVFKKMGMYKFRELKPQNERCYEIIVIISSKY